MGPGSTVIHCNSNLDYQVIYARALKSGFDKHGISCSISDSPTTPADLHVMMGPWFAYQQWKDYPSLYIDRAYWGDPECISVHWLSGGEKVFMADMPDRFHPELKPMKSGSKSIYLCDYKGKPEGHYDSVRWHPAEKPSLTSLSDDLNAHDIAIGRRTTALVDAAILGLTVKTDDPHSPVWRAKHREQWIRDLAWHNWSLTEIANGDMLDACGTSNPTY